MIQFQINSTYCNSSPLSVCALPPIFFIWIPHLHFVIYKNVPRFLSTMVSVQLISYMLSPNLHLTTYCSKVFHSIFVFQCISEANNHHSLPLCIGDMHSNLMTDYSSKAYVTCWAIVLLSIPLLTLHYFSGGNLFCFKNKLLSHHLMLSNRMDDKPVS